MDNTIVTFSDDTDCEIMTTSSSELTCLVSGFDETTIDIVNPYTITVDVNGVVDSSMTVMLLPTKQSGHTVSPTSVSPVLATTLTVTLESTYPDTLRAADFTARLVDQTNPMETRPLYVMGVDDAAKSISIKFPGAASGNYYVQVNSANIGRIDKTPLSLEVVGKITDFNPKTGSFLGGTLITIDGVNFSEDPLDNPVKVGDHYCLVETTSSTQITCRIVETGLKTSESAEIIVFLRTTEEA